MRAVLLAMATVTTRAGRGQQTLLAYNGVNALTSRTDANSHITQWAYDVQGRLTTKTYADTTTQTFAYETTTSRLKSATDALSQTKQYSYAKDDRLTGLAYVGSVNPTPNVTFAYDTYFPRPTSRTDGAGTTQFSYAPVGTLGALQVQQETTPLPSGTISYAYDQLGRVGSRTVQGSAAETVTYDAIGRLATEANELGAFTFGYLGQTGQVTSRQLASSNLATAWGYLSNAGDRRLASISTTGLTAGQYSMFQYTSNGVGQATGVTQTSDAAISYPPGTLTQTASYNALNQLTNLSGQALTWDADGNLLSDGTRTFSWDAENRLVGISYPGQPGKGTTFSYDGLGRRVTISSTPAGGGSAVTTPYVWCGLSLCQARNSGGSVTRAYYAEGEYAPGSPGQAYYYGPDRVGSVRRVFTAGQAPAYDYDPYGNPLQTTAALTDFGYAGLTYNVDSGLNLAAYRPYDPSAGRWLSRDPLGERTDKAANLYAYSQSDPVGGWDPAGLWSGTISAYDGVGGSITVGYDSSPGGGPFVTGRLGVGIGGGASFDREGGAPGPGPNCPNGKRGWGFGAFAEAGVAAGPFEYGGGGNAGVNYNTNPGGTSSQQPYRGADTPKFTVGSGAGSQISASAGVQMTVFPFALSN